MNERRDGIIPEGITKSHILQAMEDFDKNGMPHGFKPSHSYDVVYDGRAYPPPTIVALAIKSLTGELPPPVIRAGKGTRCFSILQKCGFQVVLKKQSP